MSFPPCTPECVSVVGPGRLGTAMAAALARAGIEVEGPFGRGEAVARADAVILCVPDGEIAGAAAGLDAPMVGHTSGATGLDAIAAPHAFGLHPLQTFAGGDGPERFHGAGAAVAGTTPEALAAARGLAGALGLTPFAIDDAQRGAYHAAASVASNYLVTIEAAAETLATGAGLERDQARALLAPLVRSTVENWSARGPERALTGPIARGDEQTVARQRQAVEDTAPALLDLFDSLAEATRRLAASEVPA